jgi:hypothetical protein
MEDQDFQEVNNEQLSSKLIISDTAIIYLAETGKWTKILSIIGFSFIGLIVIMGFFAGSVLSFLDSDESGMPFRGMGIVFGVIYLLMGLIYFFPTWYLFKFSQKLKQAISSNDTEELDIAFKNQKSFYKFWGLLMTIFIGIYALVLLGALIMGLLG